MSKNQQLIKRELEKLGHTGVEVTWERNYYHFRSDQANLTLLHRSVEESLAWIYHYLGGNR